MSSNLTARKIRCEEGKWLSALSRKGTNPLNAVMQGQIDKIQNTGTVCLEYVERIAIISTCMLR